jgi:serine/threonine-protein kinase RsbW
MGRIEEGSKEIRIQIPARLDHVILVGLALRGICSATTLSDIETYEIEAAVTEAVNNAVKHAYQCIPDRELEIRVALSREAITIQVRDRGKSMKKLKAFELDFDVHDRLNLPEGGMGLTIIQSSMDEVDYETLEGVNVLTMKKLIRVQ